MAKIKRICKNCQKIFHISFADRNRRKFCSQKCGWTYNMVGKRNPTKKKKIRKIISKARKGKHNSPATEFKKGLIPWNKGMKFPNMKGENNPSSRPEIRQKLSEMKRGENGSNWKGGIYPIVLRIRNCFKYKIWRTEIFKRDNYTCQECGQKGGILNADHHRVSFSTIINHLKKLHGIKELFDRALNFEPLWDTRNGQTTCKKCHLRTHNYGAKAYSKE